ncbi:MAG TPA: NAD-dependent epimerase/dehydratase family protein [Actinomycetes bacterium]|nr:NAD-dependent epimerase/dehydratase family protein [Actinomycetes bacterium]
MSGHVVVTGAAGFIGSHLTRALLDGGHEVVGVDAFTPYYAPAAKRANLADLAGHRAFRLVEGDLTELSLEPLLTGAAAVLHLAAQPGVHTSWGSGFAAYLHHNVLATQRLLEACARAEVPRLVAASSSSVYGDAPSYPTSEEAATRPVSPYGVTKLAAEHLCLAYAQAQASGLGVGLLRYFTVYGPGQRPDMAFHRFLEAAFDGRAVTVYGDGEQRRDVTYVADAVRATTLAMTAPVDGTVVNVGGGGPVTVNEALELIGRTTGRRLRVVHAPPRPGDARHTGADGARAEALLGWRSEVDLATGLAEQAAWVGGRREGRTAPAGIG